MLDGKAEVEVLQSVSQSLTFMLWCQAPIMQTCMYPNDAIVYKYTLANEEFYFGNELRHYTHIYMMKGATKEKIDSLIEELRKPGAFPEDEPKKAKPMEMPMDIETAFTTVSMLK